MRHRLVVMRPSVRSVRTRPTKVCGRVQSRRAASASALSEDGREDALCGLATAESPAQVGSAATSTDPSQKMLFARRALRSTNASQVAAPPGDLLGRADLPAETV
jgi:hypothetical protein